MSLLRMTIVGCRRWSPGVLRLARFNGAVAFYDGEWPTVTKDAGENITVLNRCRRCRSPGASSNRGPKDPSQSRAVLPSDRSTRPVRLRRSRLFAHVQDHEWKRPSKSATCGHE